MASLALLALQVFIVIETLSFLVLLIGLGCELRQSTGTLKVALSVEAPRDPPPPGMPAPISLKDWMDSRQVGNQDEEEYIFLAA